MLEDFVVFSWNVQSPSPERAGKQFQWLWRRQSKEPVDVYVLTECKNSKGSLLLGKLFRAYGYNVVFAKPVEKNEYGVLIASRHKLTSGTFKVNYLPSRVNSVMVPYIDGKIEVVGVYIPSRGFDVGPRRRKKMVFVQNFLKSLKTLPPIVPRVLIGDFNILEPNHIPHYSYFEDWEYDFYRAMRKHQMEDAFRYLNPTAQEHSWVGRAGDPYRFDHCFVSHDVVASVKKCYYLHEPRETGLSDHSAIVVVLGR